MNEERSEDLVTRIREHEVLAHASRGSDPLGAKHHDERARELLDKLWRRHHADARRAACRAFGVGNRLYEEAVGEIAREVARIILRPEGSLRGLEKRFSAAFRSVCLDGIERAGNTFSDRIGGKAEIESSEGLRQVAVVSGDAPTADRWGNESDPLSEQHDDPRALEQFETVIGHEAYRAIALLMPPRQRAVLEMRVQNKEFRQIAECLGIHPETASTDFDMAVSFVEAKLMTRQRERR